MSSVEDRYYKLNRIMLKVLGLWPYQNSKWTYVQMVAMTILSLTGTFVQLAVFVTHESTLDLIINVSSFAILPIFMLLMYHTYFFCSDTFKEVMEHIYYDWKSFKDKAEFDILDNYASTAKLFTEIFFFFYVICMLVAIANHAIPIFLDVVLPLNESRLHSLHIQVEYFFDPTKYIFLFLVHLMLLFCLGMLTILATGTSFYGYILHACAVFKIINYRLEITIDKDVLQISSSKRDNVIHERLVHAVDLHLKNLRYCDMLMSQLDKSLLSVIFIGVTSISISLMRLLQALTVYKDIIDVFIPVALLFAQLLYAFFCNHLGQQVTNNNAEIFDTVYNLPWYVVSVNMQKLVLFLLQKGNKNFYLSVGGIFNASYEFLATVLQTLITSALSYFMVIYTIYTI